MGRIPLHITTPPESSQCLPGEHFPSGAQPHCLDQVISLYLFMSRTQPASLSFKVHHGNFKLMHSREKKD